MPPKQQRVNIDSGLRPPVQTIGARRPNFGKAGNVVRVLTNHFEAVIPDAVISHYDVVILPPEKTLPSKLNLEIIRTLQETVSPAIFTPRAVYDGRKNLFAPRTLPLADDMGEFEVPIHDSLQSKSSKGPKIYRVRLKLVAQVNPETLRRYLEGKQSHDNSVLTAITALNVVIRMQPNLSYPFNVRSFFTPRGKKDIGSGYEVWRGFFQSARPALGKMLINIDISTAIMFKPGNLLSICLEFLNQKDPKLLSPKKGFKERDRIKLQRFLAGVRVVTSAGGIKTVRVVRKVSEKSANDTLFALREGGKKSVSNYFRETYNIHLKFPDIVCAEVGVGAVVPLELCEIPPGQFVRRQVPPEKTRDVLEFATLKPSARLETIKSGLEVLAYGQSDYVRQFGMSVDQKAEGPLQIQARILPPPALRYGQGSKNATLMPRDGAWNLINQKLYRPCSIKGWCIAIYEIQQRFNQQSCDDLIRGLASACRDTGIQGLNPADVMVRWMNGQGNVPADLRSLGGEYQKAKGHLPMLIVVVLPESGVDIYTAVKHFGDCQVGVATQCLKANKCTRAKPQYFANVCLKMNVKMGGINCIPDARSVQFLTDPNNPTVVMGADVIHPAPGADGRPSFTSLVANVDSDTSKYIADTRVQTSRQEMIDDLEEMAAKLLSSYRSYRQAVEKKSQVNPKRIIFYRDGVSEGQFKTVLETEVPRIKAACAKLGITPPPKLTVLVVGKRHHVRFFPTDRADRSGNCPAGTIVDHGVTAPNEYDFYLQSHGGLLGTSRPAHYNVLLDENNFQADGIQQLSYALCHVYARSTRSVSIPAPVYYADIVCSRAKNHYDPNASRRLSEEQTDVSETEARKDLEYFRAGFRPLHPNTARFMYFS